MTVKISPIFNDAQLDASGNPWSGAQLFTYAAGSSTKTTTYQDSAGATPHANPIVLNSRGEPPAPIWLTSGVTYKFVLTSPTDTDPPVSATRTVDNVAGVNDTTVTLDQWVAGPAPTFIGTTSFSLVGDQTTTFHVGRRLKTTNSGGTIYSTISVSAYTTLTTLTVVNDSGVLDSGLSAVSYGLLSSASSSLPRFPSGLALAMGSGSGSAVAIGTAHINTTTVGNVGAGTDDLMSYTLPANSLSANGKGVRITAWGSTNGNANAKTLTMPIVGGASGSVALTTSLAGTWIAEITIWRTGVGTQISINRLTETAAGTTLGTPQNVQFTGSTSADETVANVMKFTCAATTDNDITQRGMLVEFIG